MTDIKELIVVEGEHDKQKLLSFLNADIIVTNGIEISNETIELIKEISKTRDIIVFTDPDVPGEKIRKIIMKNVPNAKHAFIDKKKAQGKRNLGVENAKKEDILESLKNIYTVSEFSDTLDYSVFIKTGIPGNKKLREFVASYFNLGVVNNKQLFKRLNMFSITEDQLIDVIEKYEG